MTGRDLDGGKYLLEVPCDRRESRRHVAAALQTFFILRPAKRGPILDSENAHRIASSGWKWGRMIICRLTTNCWAVHGSRLNPSLRDQLETDDSGKDQGNAYQPQRRRWLCEQVDAERRGTDCSDPGPHRISGPDRIGL